MGTPENFGPVKYPGAEHGRPMIDHLSIRVGDLVKCIDADDTNSFGIEELIEGAFYTVSWIGLYGDRIVIRVREFDRNKFAAAIGEVSDELDFFSIGRFWPC